MGCGGSTPAEPVDAGPRSPRADVQGRPDNSAVPARQNGGSDPDAGTSLRGSRQNPNPKRREAYSSGKQAMSAGPAQATQPAATPKSHADMEQLRKSCKELVLFNSMTTEQQEKIFEAMFEVRHARGRRRHAHAMWP